MFENCTTNLCIKSFLVPTEHFSIIKINGFVYLDGDTLARCTLLAMVVPQPELMLHVLLLSISVCEAERFLIRCGNYVVKSLDVTVSK